jgi:hypothetical protein
MNKDDEIEVLLRLAGRRPGVPGEREERARAAVHAAWRRTVRIRRRRRTGWMVALAAAASVLVALPWLRPIRTGDAPSGPDRAALTVESVRGAAWSEPPRGPRRELQRGLGVEAGAAVVTGDGRLELRHGASGAIRLDTGTRMTLLDEHTLHLDEGGLYIDSGNPERPGSPAVPEALAIRTPMGSLQAEGTQYEVRLDGKSMILSVREGTVRLEHGGQVHRVARARRITVGAGDAVAFEEIPTHGPSWSWTAEIATVPDFSGRSARAFLEWVARERGLELRFGDPALERSADTILLGGSVGRLRLDEALDAVLPTCGMRHQVEAAWLVILAE